MKSVPRLDVDLKRPRAAPALVAGTHLATAALIALLPLPNGLDIGGAAIVTLCGLWILMRICGTRAPAALTLDLDRRIVVRVRGGATATGTIEADSCVGPRVTTIVWRPDGACRVRTLLLLPDALAAEDFRRLRVMLRYGRVPLSAAGTSGVEAG
jgi:toxin CptA